MTNTDEQVTHEERPEGFPSWLKRTKGGAFEVDPDIAYPLVLAAMKVEPDKYDQYSIECAYQCTKLAVQDFVEGTKHDPRVGEKPYSLVILINSDDGRKDRWALVNFEPGRGIAAATKGMEAKRMYPTVRKALLG